MKLEKTEVYALTLSKDEIEGIVSAIAFTISELEGTSRDISLLQVMFEYFQVEEVI